MAESTSTVRPEAEVNATGAQGGAGFSPPTMPVQPFEGQKGEGFSLLDPVADGIVTLPREHRAQKALFKFLRKAGSDSRVVAEIHRLRDSVILSAVREKSHTGGMTVALTGSAGGVGSSSLSILLGLSLGECVSRRVAILDGRFNVPRFQFLSDVLGLSKSSMSIQSGSSEVVGYSNEAYPNVYFLRNASAQRTLQFFSDKKLGTFIADLRQNFDFTIIDLPPLLTETASVFVTPHVDRLYLVAEVGKTRLMQVGACIQTIRQAGGQLNGVILNKQRTPLWSRLIWREFFY